MIPAPVVVGKNIKNAVENFKKTEVIIMLNKNYQAELAALIERLDDLSDAL